MILAYRVITTLIYPILIILIFVRKLIKKEDQIRYREKIFSSYFNVIRKKNTKLIWFHAASIGEIKSIIPILKNLIENNKNYEFLLTTITHSSGELIKKEIKNYENVYHRYLPIDVDFLISKFFKLWKPSAIFLVDSEIWPNLIIKAKKNKTPIAIINARLTKKTFKKWMLIPKSAKSIFSTFKLCLSSNIESKNYLAYLDVKSVYHFGNIKLINNFENNGKENIYNFFEHDSYWCAVSTHRDEEKFCLDVHLKLKKIYKNIVTVLAPRHIQRSDEIKKLCDKFNINSQIITGDEKILKDREVVIINSFGVLPAYFKFAKSVFMGKSILKKFENEGGQNPIEAARFGCKIYHGLYIYNFEDIYKTLEKNGISKKIGDQDELVDHLINDLSIKTKQTEKFTSIINNLSNKTYIDTIREINKFLKNEVI